MVTPSLLQPWSFFLFILPCWSLRGLPPPQTLTEGGSKGPLPDLSILDLLSIRAPRLDSFSPRAHGRGPAELLAPFLSCQGDPS